MVKCIINFLNRSFISNCKELKKENIKLRKDIYLLVKKENSLKGIEVKCFWKMQYDMTDIILFGNYGVNKLGG